MAKTAARKPADKSATKLAPKPVDQSARHPSGANPRGYQDILYEVNDGVAWVTINRPRVLNAFREQTLDEMIDALRTTRHDPSIACAVLTGRATRRFRRAAISTP
jgi:1,4-dihydroxy-2-naphthoyl-CoA synthase